MKKTPRICKRWWTGCGGDEFAAGYVFSAGLICHGMKKRNTKFFGVPQIGADSGIRTRDLVLTKDVLYLLSHISKALSLTSFIILPENRKKVK